MSYTIEVRLETGTETKLMGTIPDGEVKNAFLLIRTIQDTLSLMGKKSTVINTIVGYTEIATIKVEE